MSFSDERQKRLLEGYGEPQEIEYLDEHLNDEVVPDLEFFLKSICQWQENQRPHGKFKMHISKA